jgi:hypothetical protein
MRSVHKLHRVVGNAIALLMATWFASGAVMTFARYPSYSEHERLVQAPVLTGSLPRGLPDALQRWLHERGLAGGSAARLSVLEGSPTWTFTDPQGRLRALRTQAPFEVRQLDAQRVRAEAERRFGLSAQLTTAVERPDQWTVGRVDSEFYPLFRVEFSDPAGTQVYVSSRSGEVVQASTRLERALCWVGAIPHWIYPALLRRERELWRTTVLALSSIGLCLTLSGLAAGIHSQRTGGKRNGAASGPVTRNAYLRWHQRIGLAFGALASTWLFSGALSLSPFHWSGSGPSTLQLERIHGWSEGAAHDSERIAEAFVLCQRALELRELEVRAFGGRAVAVCRNAVGRAVLVDLAQPELATRAQLSAARVRAVAERMAAQHPFTLHALHEPDDYYYPTHSEPNLALPVVRVAIADSSGSTFYVDPEHAQLVQYTTQARRLERWLYNGLHSLDFAPLYRQRILWRTCVIAAMLGGLTLSGLGVALSVSRSSRRLRRPATARIIRHGTDDRVDRA